MADLDRMTARSLVEAGYMPVSVYIEMFGAIGESGNEAPLVPALESDRSMTFGTVNLIDQPKVDQPR